MLWRLSDLKNKEVINLQNGAKIGFVGDIEIDITNGNVKSIIVPASSGFFAKKEDYVIPFSDIQKAGNDLILVSYEPQDVEAAKNGKRRFFDF